MKLITISLTIAILALGYAAGFYAGHYQGRDEAHTAMMDSMANIAMPQMRAR